MPAPAPIGFDKMRAMLARAADLRADEQRQVVDLIDEVRGRLTPIEGFVEDGRGRIAATHDTVATIRDRLGELPDRTEVSVIAERLDDTLARIDSQDAVLATISTSVAALSDRVGRPLEAIEARLDGVVGRFEGVSGRLDGLDDRLQHLHARLDELDATVGHVQGAVGAVQGAVGELPGQLDPASVHRRFDELAGSVHQRFDDEFVRLDALAGRPAVDPTGMLDGLASKLDALGGRLDGVASRVNAVEESVRNNAGNLAGTLEQGLDKLHGTVGSRPDRDEFGRTLSKSQHESERRITQQLDGALADFAEVMLGQGVIAKAAPARTATRKSGKKTVDDD